MTSSLPFALNMSPLVLNPSSGSMSPNTSSLSYFSLPAVPYLILPLPTFLLLSVYFSSSPLLHQWWQPQHSLCLLHLQWYLCFLSCYFTIFWTELICKSSIRSTFKFLSIHFWGDTNQLSMVMERANAGNVRFLIFKKGASTYCQLSVWSRYFFGLFLPPIFCFSLLTLDSKLFRSDCFLAESVYPVPST